MKRTLKCLAGLAAFALLLGAANYLAMASAQATQDALFQRAYEWDQQGWPDDIGGVYLDADGDTYALLVVAPTPEREEELRAQIGNDLVITPAQYSLNELKAIKEEIIAGVNLDSMVYAVDIDCKIRGHVEPGVMRGFGLSGSEVCVIVNVDARRLGQYAEELAGRYGEKVHVISTPDAVFSYWLEQWEMYGYPDDIDSQYRDLDTYAVGIGVVDPAPERLEELRAVFGEDALITRSKYSHNELYRVREEIEALMAEPDSKIYGLGVGWSSDENGVFGFGESGRESRVVVTVDESVYTDYGDEFARSYGDMVFVEAGGPVILDGPGAEEDIRGAINPWTWAAFGICLLGLVAMPLWRVRRRKKNINTSKGYQGTMLAHWLPQFRHKRYDVIRKNKKFQRMIQ